MPSLGASMQTIIRFDTFELKVETGELLKSGTLVRLSPQALSVLILLTRSSRQFVTREELQAEVWGGTLVDFEHGLNRCIKQIRSALCDSADNPRFVETLRGRGYRFLMPTESRDASAAGGRDQPDETRKSLGVLKFKNLSERPEQAWISGALAEMFTTELAIGGRLVAFPLENGGKRRDWYGASGTGISSLVRQLEERTVVHWLVSGAYTVVGRDADEHIRFDVRVQDTANGDFLVAFSETDALANLSALVSRAGERLRKSLDSKHDQSFKFLRGSSNFSMEVFE